MVIRFIALSLCLSSILISILPQRVDSQTKFGYTWEDYEPSLFNRLQNINDIIDYCDSVIGKQNRRSITYNDFLGRLLGKRFYHGFSYYSFKDNPIAFIAGKIIWQDLSAIVLPNDIMKYPMAACSQQALVRKACFEKIGMPFRKIALKGHFVLEGLIEGNWYLFDSNLEPNFTAGRKSLKDLLSNGEVYSAYRYKKSISELKHIFSNPTYGKINGYFAPNATLFQYFSKIVFYLLPFAGLTLFLGTFEKNKKLKERGVIRKIATIRFYKKKEIA